MPEEEKLPIPLEIPWKLAATNQKRHSGDPYDSTIALFYYEPKTDTLEIDYPDERLIYIKACISLCPANISMTTTVKDYLTGFSPVWHAIFDLKVKPKPDTKDLIRPYFHSVAPLNREMIQTGVVGNDQSNAQSDSVAVGKSASALHEKIDSEISTSTSGKSMDLGIVGGSSASSSTSISTDRTIYENIDTTYRESSTERRELLSHHTNVTNVLSLLSAKHVGSPYVQFSMWPRPVSLLSLDPGDENLWYTELLRRRSSGIEGQQEFIFVLAVPTGQNFCIEADLKRFFVLDKPPTPPKFTWDFGFTETDIEAFEQMNFITDYLYKRYPRGTPLDDLDLMVELDKNKYPRPAVQYWSIYGSQSNFPPWVVGLAFQSPVKFTLEPNINTKYPAPPISVGITYYKTIREVFLEAEMSRYQEELSRSPLERGEVFGKGTKLNSCFQQNVDAPLTVISFGDETYEITTDMKAYIALAQPPKQTQSAVRKWRAVASRWNEVQHQFSKNLTNVQDWSEPHIDLSSQRTFDIFLDIVSHLDTTDPRNLPIKELAGHLELPAKLKRRLMDIGIKDFRSLVRYIRNVPNYLTKREQLQHFNKTLSQVYTLEDCEVSKEFIPIGRETELDMEDCKQILNAIQDAWKEVDEKNKRSGKKRTKQR